MNVIGIPIGAAIGGALADRSLALAIVPAVVASVAGVVFAATMVPRTDLNPGSTILADLAAE